MLDTEAPECEDQAEGLLPPNQQLTIGVHEHDASSDGSSWYSGMGIKGIVLGLFVLQASSYVLLRRYSLGVLKETYSTTSALLVMECTKLAVSLIQIIRSDAESDVPAGTACSKYWYLATHSKTMLVPASLYLMMNILGFVSLGKIDAITFIVVSQMKVFSTAICSVFVLGRELSAGQWRALLLLVLGAVLISHQSAPANDTAEDQRASTDYLIGLLAISTDVALCGFVSIYFEKVLKCREEVYSVWDRNFQLAMWSILIYLPPMIYHNPTDPFAGWSPTAALCAVVGGVGGILAAFCLKYADAILKTLATTISIVCVSAFNVLIMGNELTLPVAIGGLVVIISVFNYNNDKS